MDHREAALNALRALDGVDDSLVLAVYAVTHAVLHLADVARAPVLSTAEAVRMWRLWDDEPSKSDEGISHDEAVQRAAVELGGDVVAAKRVVAAIFPLSGIRRMEVRDVSAGE